MIDLHITPNKQISPAELREGDVIFKQDSLGKVDMRNASILDWKPQMLIKKVKTQGYSTYVTWVHYYMSDDLDIAPNHVEIFYKDQPLLIHRFSLKNVLNKL